ncbi:MULTISPECIES: hypothetical protein [Myxococcus]|uniref:Uncharacterized protein n=1 Tax=Myxococcus llanfairpwllgwyngyllgogerychwyrndrobwllllantysiliogogogochensis TaxID=2590453 RepID=A0A540X6C8_9BACT|nr:MULTISPECIES: hypothetical protein [Myxococcus]NTX09067.1 hypothetical protein [Myxococcus sp. CA040A]TQF16821.1 hypothetical protein FJV41_06625 [Myxococcus llanfairpwllgwyngyllgogerychwyrndrobwllllantysiliogogogochensis]
MRETLVKLARRVLALARKELAVHGRLHRDVLATLRKLEARSPEFARARARAHACVVFPSLGQGSVVLGGVWGLGEVFVRGRLVGYSALVQLTLGVQLGGQTSSEVILFEDREAFERLKKGRTGLALGGAVTLVKAGVAWARGPKGSTAVALATRGGLWAGVGLGMQRLFFVPAVLTRGGVLREGLPSLAFSRARTSAPRANGTRENMMAKAQASKSGRKGLEGPSALGRRISGADSRKVSERARAAVQKVGERGRQTVEHLRERVPSGREIQARAGQARTWAADQMGAHAVAIGLTTLAAGIAGAALLPVSDRERRALSSASGKVKSLSHSIGESQVLARARKSLSGVTKSVGDRVSRARSGGTPEVAEQARVPRKNAPARGRKTSGRSAAAKTSRPTAKRASPKRGPGGARSTKKAGANPTHAKT